MIKIVFSLFLCVVLLSSKGIAQTIIKLYSGVVPNAVSKPPAEISDTPRPGRIQIRNVSVPTLTAFFPEEGKANGAAILIFPGGGYRHLEISHVGYQIAKEFIKAGVTAFVVKYRLPDNKVIKDKTIGPLQDAQQAMKVVREHAAQWGLDTTKIGVAGFSAGGHVAVTLSTHYVNALIDNKEKTSLRPDFMILGWPVISMTDSLTHKGSRDLLLGVSPDEKAIREYSGELQVTNKTPPAFIVHAADDKTVKISSSILFYQALLKNGDEAELHIYAKGGHGFGINNSTTPDKWVDHCLNWMRVNKWIINK